MINLADRHIMIVGGSRGIGAACAEMAAEAGADVSITYQRADKAAADVVKKIESMGVNCIAVRANAANEQDMAAALDTVSDKLGIPQGFVISAAIYQETTNFEEMPLEVWENVTRTNITGTFISAKAYAIRALKHKIKGSLVIITSVSGQAGAVTFMLSDLAGHVTGTTLVVDGGMTMR